jgi:hypothetical protein
MLVKNLISFKNATDWLGIDLWIICEQKESSSRGEEHHAKAESTQGTHKAPHATKRGSRDETATLDQKD